MKQFMKKRKIKLSNSNNQSELIDTNNDMSQYDINKGDEVLDYEQNKENYAKRNLLEQDSEDEKDKKQSEQSQQENEVENENLMSGNNSQQNDKISKNINSNNPNINTTSENVDSLTFDISIRQKSIKSEIKIESPQLSSISKSNSEISQKLESFDKLIINDYKQQQQQNCEFKSIDENSPISTSYRQGLINKRYKKNE
ncbi:hypothetical protein PPERSA_04778 [Pseudocohnilembus persalinus]|uniref:Uncharacterized protein n=1 Tax=Pseudocohnilembus persalinus TaxID=266149 RepID=A0A0V0Q9C3_PSEPJ|nr:hypothetical protein PPERSA_04778 [Pseudocohnilembus persalinus]|eukprot:KRW98845.1 hypothetical protein PPERSA_04778 [Pseudocohnilembus persalinus]